MYYLLGDIGMNKEINLEYLRSQFDYMVFMILVKTIGYIQLNKGRDPILLENIVREFNIFFNINCDETNILDVGKEIIHLQFFYVIQQLKEGCFDGEFEITDKILESIEDLKDQDIRFKNRGDMFADYQDGNYYRFFLRFAQSLTDLDSSTIDVGLGETLYHSFARFGAAGVDEYFEYFKQMCECNLVNYQNQSQQYGFCNCNPCTYWLLNSKKQLLYFNDLIQTKDIKLNHICGNEKGPSAFGIITEMLYEKKYWDRVQRKFLELDEEHKTLLCETLYNLAKSNYSIGFDEGKIEKLLQMNLENDSIKNMFHYLVSEEGIAK